MKKNTSSAIFIISILVVSIISIIIHNSISQKSDAAMVQKAFNASGAKIVSSEIYIRGGVKKEACDDFAKKQVLLSDVIKGMGGNVTKAVPVFSCFNNDISSGCEVTYALDEDRSIWASLSESKEDTEDTKESYMLAVTVSDSSAMPDIESSVESIERIFEQYDIKTTANISVTGCMDGSLSDESIDEMRDRIFKSVRADEVEGIDDNGLLSIEAFSPNISNSVKVKGKKVNLNLAVRYNSYEGKTYIWLATPIITTEY